MHAAACSDVGLRRRQNQDRYVLAPGLGLFLVADGMGGHRGGQVASQIAAEAVLREVEATRGRASSASQKLRDGVTAANREIFEAASAKPELEGMGTTLVGILVGAGRMALLHVGDSRAYLVRAGRVRLLTDDHSLVGELLRRREISVATARDHPHRHVLTRALGVRRTVEPDLAELTPLPGDVVALCSDGLTQHVGDEEIRAAVERGADLQRACDGLVDLANRRGGEDNITVVLIRIESADLGEV